MLPTPYNFVSLKMLFRRYTFNLLHFDVQYIPLDDEFEPHLGVLPVRPGDNVGDTHSDGSRTIGCHRSD